ncbi:hypothetical protein H4Q26_015529 [Puccinia striiformis f. sp. tritici PST-130]|uniref:Uncharacterized protein n=3 Tax=Puccinia striiformis TaxID=27350 RepID=A0A0L0UXQ9_9BASI|nr:hypothetical protein H4Q26_015529 [Puccinia striiformis f. sp. tritici PST-130]KNE91810.1 hypothetical protein PSTG_14770 [Puccinia striiformis f. sp. tritici PST-78]POW15191.1 hypothetical protein PSTT_02328 [Puccinia striiformis]
MEQFGPTSQWSAWAFERLNGNLASITHNNQIRKIDKTLMSKSVMAQNLISTLPSLSAKLPQEFKDALEKIIPSSLSSSFRKISAPPQAEMLAEDSRGNGKRYTLSEDEYNRLLWRLVQIEGRKLISSEEYFKRLNDGMGPGDLPVFPYSVQSHKRISYLGDQYTIKDKHIGNSTVKYLHSDNSSSAKVQRFGHVVGIFSISYSPQIGAPSNHELWLDVSSFDALSKENSRLNPLEAWPDCHIHVAHSHQSERHFIRIDEILSQATMWQAPENMWKIEPSIIFLTSVISNIEF